MAKYLCIVAGQRTGTTALRSALGSTGKFFNCDEIFHTEHRKWSFLEYAKQRHLEVAEMAMPEQAGAVARDYLSYLTGVAGQKIPILDVKLNSWHVIRPFWGYSHQIPFFMNILNREGSTFLFIRRRDLTAQIVSMHIARGFNKWQAIKADDVDRKISLNIADVRNQARHILQSEMFLLSFLRRSKRFAAIDYEELFPEGNVNLSLVSKLEELMEVTFPKAVRPSTTPSKIDKSATVVNYDAVSQAVDGIIARHGRPTLEDFTV